jgi:hypothetical protein
MGWLKKKEEKPESNLPEMTDEQRAYVAQVLIDKMASEGGYRQTAENYWSDEYLCLKGDQWDTTLAPRDAKKKSKRPNIVLNVSLPTIMNIVDALTASTPQADVTGREKSDKEVALKISDIISFVFDRNVFDKQWRDIVMQGVHYGPFIGYVPWDPEFMGGAGPNRWVGEIRTLCQKKDEIYFDPAIKDLEENLQDCRFIHQRYPKNLDYIKDRWENGKYVTAELLDDEDEEAGGQFDYQRATVICSWHRGVPLYISEQDKERFKKKATEAKDEYAKTMYEDMANGTLKGVHCAYTAGNVFLEYVPYVYEDGLYPFAYAVLYQDEKNPYGYGEMRNILSPQIAYNKCAEIEMAAAAVEGLGGGYYDKGSISKSQMDEINENSCKAGVWHEVNNKDRMQRKEGTQTPQSLVQYKDFLKINIDTISQNTAIMQGVSPGANVPYKSVAELGSRADVRNKGKMNILERFMTQFMRLMISRIAQFYTDEREYRIRGDKSMAIKTLIYDGLRQLLELGDDETAKQAQLAGLIQLFETIRNMDPNTADTFGKFSNQQMKHVWMRDDENGQKKEEVYIAEFDVKVKITDERPTSRTYYENLALEMFKIGAIGPKAFWETIYNGQLPPPDEITQELKEMQSAKAQEALAQKTAGNNPVMAQAQNKQAMKTA